MNINEKYIYMRLFELSSVDLQRKLWLNQNNKTGYISSYSELMCSLFDDFNFNDFVDNFSTNNKNSTEIITELNKIRSMLVEFNSDKTDEEIIRDKDWVKIVNKAKFILNKLQIKYNDFYL